LLTQRLQANHRFTGERLAQRGQVRQSQRLRYRRVNLRPHRIRRHLRQRQQRLPTSALNACAICSAVSPAYSLVGIFYELTVVENSKAFLLQPIECFCQVAYQPLGSGVFQDQSRANVADA